MAFVQAKCENCGGILTVDPTLKAAICPFCGGAYVVQDSINYYNSVTKIEHLHADVVNISNEESSEGRLKAAETFMKLKKYSNAESEYKTVTEMAPQNLLGWRGLIEANTHSFTRRVKNKTDINKLDDYIRSVKILEPGE